MSRSLVRALHAGAFAVLVGVYGCAPSAITPTTQAQVPKAPSILLPEMLAIEVPAPGMTSLDPSAAPLRELLGSASSASLHVTHDVRAPLPLGASQVTWTAWSGAPDVGQIMTTRQAWVYLFPFGQTPAGVSGRHDATAGNHAAKVVRDRSGRVHVAWLDGGRPGRGTSVLYRSGVQDPVTGRFGWDNPAAQISEPGAVVGLVAMEVSPNALHFAWSTPQTTLYRRVLMDGGKWRAEPTRDTRASGSTYDNGPDLGVRGDDEIHVLTYTGQYAVSRNGGARWSVDQVPWPGGEKKNPALAVDALGNAHIVYTLKVRERQNHGGGRLTGGYWQLRYVRRQAHGGWVDSHDALGAFPEWADKGLTRDSMADWPDIAADRHGNLHVVFHGTANSGRYGWDEAFYVRRPAAGPGAWNVWEPPQSLHPINRATAEAHSFAPSLALDPESDTVVAVVFFDYENLAEWIFDSDALLLRGGRIVGPPIPLSRGALTARDANGPDDALSSWFTSAAPRLYRQADGRLWLDVLYTAQTPERHGSPHYVVYQRADVTDALQRSLSPGPLVTRHRHVPQDHGTLRAWLPGQLSCGASGSNERGPVVASIRPRQARRGAIQLVRLTAVALVALAATGCAFTETPPGPMESVIVTPAADTLLVGDSQQLVALGKDGRGRPLPGRDISWTSLNPETATVSPTGVVSGQAPGTAQIVATSEGKSATAVITVWPTRKDTAECDAPKPGWIWCDDFEKDRLSAYFEYAAIDGSFVRLPGVGYGGSAGMRARFSRTGQVQAGSLKLAIGKTPAPYFRPVDAGTARYREIYWRHLVKLQAGWIGAGGNKLSRAQVLVNTNWAQAMMAHVWSGIMSEGQPYHLGIVPASGTDESGTVRTTEYNDFPHVRWLGTVWSRTPIFDRLHVGKWYCIEAHARLNDPGRANGIFELWIGGGLEARIEGLNWQGAYSEYGINTVFLENYWNDGAPQPQERYFDNFVVSTQRIGC